MGRGMGEGRGWSETAIEARSATLLEACEPEQMLSKFFRCSKYGTRQVPRSGAVLLRVETISRVR